MRGPVATPRTAASGSRDHGVVYTAEVLAIVINGLVGRRAPFSVRRSPQTVLELDGWLTVVVKDGQFHLADCPCDECKPDDPYLADAA